MAEIFGAVVAGVTVCHEMTRIAKAIKEVAKTIKNAPKNISKLSDETVIFTGLYSTFLQTCEDDPTIRQGAAMSIDRLKTWSEITIKCLRQVLREGDAIRPDVDYRYSLRLTWKAHWKWLVRRNVVEALRASLSVARQSIEGFSNLMCIRKLNEELALFRSALSNLNERRVLEQRLGTSLENKIQSIETSLKIRQSVRLTNASMLQECRNEVKLQERADDTSEAMTVSEDAIDLADTFETFLEEIVPAQSTSRYGHGPTSSEASSNPSNLFTRSSPHTRSVSSSSDDSSVSMFGRYPMRPMRPMRPSTSPATSRLRPTPRPAQPQNHAGPSVTGRSDHTTVNSVRQVIHDGHTSAAFAPVPLRIKRRPRKATIGPHTIILTAEHLYFNKHLLSIHNRLPGTDGYEVASRFYDELLVHRDKLDELELALGRSEPQGEWFGISGWKVDLDGVTMQAEALGIRDV